jgi:general secretion pathway protein D
MTLRKAVSIASLAMLVAGCGLAPVKPSEQHIHAEPPKPEGAIPPPVQVAPILPKPQPGVRPETYSVVVNRVPAQELLFALARDAKLQIDIDPSLGGLVTLNAVDQTLPQLLSRIARQVDMRYEIDGQNLHIMRDTPFLRSYKVDYLSANRGVTMRSTASTQFGSTTSTSGGGGAGPSSTGATSVIEVTSQNHLWDSIVQNVREILRETDKILPAPGPGAAPIAAPAPAPAAAPGQPAGAPPAAPVAVAASPTFQEAASVIANRESGVLFVRATAKQHERVQEFMDQVMAGAKRQVLIEATVAEVQLNNKYQRGIDWQRIRNGTTGFQLTQPAAPPPSGFNPPNPFTIGYLSANFTFNISLLEQFGDVRVLSSPKLSVLNNQTATLRVTRDIIYFTLTPSTTPVTIAASLGAPPINAIAFTTTPIVAAEGFMMAVLPQISDADAIVLNVRPTIRRQVGVATDPNPALQGLATQNTIPLFETREFDSILRLRSGESAVLAGLMQDQVSNNDSGIPGLRSIPFLGDILTSRDNLTTKTELVIFLRATVIHDPSLDGDFSSFREQLPRSDFMSRPNPGATAPLVVPQGAK